MPHYKLTYFGIRGRGESLRILFALAGVPYEDHRITKEEWQELRSTTPFGKMPVLEVDGEKLAQTSAIHRYLGKKFGFCGKDNWESAQIDALGDLFQDHFVEISPFLYTIAGFRTGDKDALIKDVVLPARDKFLATITNILKENPSGFLVGDSVSWVDVLVAEHIWAMRTFVKGFSDGFIEVEKFVERVRSISAYKKWIETRPETPM